MIEAVRVYAVDQNNAPLEGVLVRVFDASGTNFITQGLTSILGQDAYAEFDLDGGDPPIEYTIRLYKTGVAFDGSLGNENKAVQRIAIYSPPQNAPSHSNYFRIRGETFDLPAATDPYLCRATGFFRDASGRPLSGLSIILINQFKPTIVDGYGVLGAKISLVTDTDGRVSVDLYRNGIYKAYVESVQAAHADPAGAIVFMRDVHVPDRSYANLIDLLFPVVSEIVWPIDSINIRIGETIELKPTVKCTDGRILDGVAVEDVTYLTRDKSVAIAQALRDKIIVLGVSEGSTVLTASRRDNSIMVLPAFVIKNATINITVRR